MKIKITESLGPIVTHPNGDISITGEIRAEMVVDSKEYLFKKGLKYEVHKFILGPHERFNITATLKNKGEIKKLLDQEMLEYCKETKISISMVPARKLLIIDFSIFRRKDNRGNWIFREQIPLNFEI